MTFIAMTLSGESGADVFRGLARTLHCQTPPLAVKHDFADAGPVQADWVECVLRAPSDGRARWATSDLQLGYRAKSGPLVSATIPVPMVRMEDALALIDPLPFEICAFGAVFFDEWIAAKYDRTSFSRSHIQHGWACAFRGKGHDRLVSRRWLDFGPWRVIRRPNDTTFIQFHDLAITDPAEAYAQAWPGHERMGISDTGGFIQHIMEPLVENVRYLYVRDQRRAEIVVAPGNAVPQWDMTCARALRLYTQMNPGVPNPIDHVAYIFVDERDARAHLHELWLRELECWVADDKGKRRIDLNYHPVPDPPEWVKRLDGRSEQR